MLILHSGELQIRLNIRVVWIIHKDYCVEIKLCALFQVVIIKTLWNSMTLTISTTHIIVYKIGLNIQDENDEEIYVLYICYVEHNKLFF